MTRSRASRSTETIKASLGFFDKLLFGVGYNHREKNRVDSSNDWTNGSGQYGTLVPDRGL